MPRISAHQLTSAQLVFLYKLVEGVASSSFGTHVANLAGVPPEVVQRAEVVSDDFAKQFKEKMQVSKQGSTSRLPLSVQADFAYLAKLVAGLSLPDDPTRSREVIQTIRQTVAKVSSASS